MIPKDKRFNKKQLLRIVDANLNRSKEGLRVCEDLARFILEDRHLSREFRSLRHQLSRSIRQFGFSELLESRNSKSDIGKTLPFSKYNKAKDIFVSNSQRIKESVRVLEELSRLYEVNIPKQFRNIRFKVYYLEKLVYKKIK